MRYMDGSRKAWGACCDDACKRINPSGVTQATKCKTIEEWNRAFRKIERFPNPNQKAGLGKTPLPELLQKHPSLIDDIKHFCVKNLATLSIEKVHEHVKETFLDPIYVVWKEECKDQLAPGDDDGINMDDFFKSTPYSRICP
jgi:hypothetical protein